MFTYRCSTCMHTLCSICMYTHIQMWYMCTYTMRTMKNSETHDLYMGTRAYIHTYIHTYIHILYTQITLRLAFPKNIRCALVHDNIHTLYIYVCIYMYVYTYIQTYMHTYIHTHIYIHTNTHIRTYTRTHAYIHT